MPKLKIKKGDQVVVLSGDDKGKTGEVVKSMPKEGKVVHLDMPRPSNPEFEKILKSLKGL